MLKIRLKRFGRKKKPIYRIVLMQVQAKRDGKAIEEFGFYNPLTKKYKLNASRVDLRLKQGAQMSKTAYNLYKKIKEKHGNDEIVN